MKEVTITIGDVKQVFEFPEETTDDQILAAIVTGVEVIGGRPKRFNN